ncbi:hypothetical protein Pmani_033451 [Petrolisthes manimaculis]|uniref:28S ribosomal protein S22, mitochondrial n=1 Tax=Petrolisthes manimaculis TaxID=1843537 RepID=A0AAE1TQN1_9EUCA|nr:hypothetical protein Pmani_033451 [Petrolisthes manimaculis]
MAAAAMRSFSVVGSGIHRFLGLTGRCLDLECITSIRRCSNTSYTTYNDRDPAPLFFEDEVQVVLQRVTGMDIDRIFRRRQQEKKSTPPKYQFLTNEEVDEYMSEARVKAESLLQMPPVLKERQPINNILETNTSLQAHHTDKYVFADITFGVSDRNRTILVRETDGTLRSAWWEERDRINQTYNPRPGRNVVMPKLFNDENLKSALARQEYEFVLDRVCAQCEPDSSVYQRVCVCVYDALDTHHHHNTLYSTRHYGPMCFYLAWNKRIDSLLVSLIQEEKINTASDIVYLYQLIHKDCKSAKLNIEHTQHVEFIKGYIEEDCLQRAQVQLALQCYQDLQHQRQQHQHNVTNAHGL